MGEFEQPFRVTRIISLGGNCAVAHNLRRVFDFGEAFPFDWWITPFEGLLQFLIRPDVDWLYDPAKLELTPDNFSVRHRELGILLYHEFRREPVKPHLVKPNFLDAIAGPKARTTRLIEKLLALDLAEESLVFVRQRERSEPIGNLMPVLGALYRNAEWHLLTVPPVASDRAVHGWKGDPALWDRVLTNLPIQFERRDAKRYSPSRPEQER
jgi:hypothetical protein